MRTFHRVFSGLLSKPQPPVRCARRSWAVALATLAWAPACVHAELKADDPGRNVELVFVAWENNSGIAPKVAFVKDLGITMPEFFTLAQVDTGVQRYWYLGGDSADQDPAFKTFLATPISGTTTPDVTKIRWAVFAANRDDGQDGTPGAIQVYTTNQQGVSGAAGTILGLSTTKTDNLTNMPGPFFDWTGSLKGQLQSVFGATATVDNGSAVIKATDTGGVWPWGSAGLLAGVGSSFQLGNPSGRDISNVVGQSSWFYYLTGSDGNNTQQPVLIDEFDNLTSDGYWGFAAASGAAHAGQYFLSYNLAGSTTALEAQNHVLAGNNFARLAGVMSLSSSAGKGGNVLTLTESFLRGFAKTASTLPAAADDPAQALASSHALDAVAPVPETSTAVLFGLGLAAVAACRLRSRRVA